MTTPNKYIKKYSIPISPMDAAETSEAITLYLLEELESWSVTIPNKAFASVVGCGVALVINEANKNKGEVNLKSTMFNISQTLSEQIK